MQEPSGYGKWLLYRPKYDSARTIIVSDNVLALLKRTRELLFLDQENCGEYYKKIYMNYDEENHILLPTTDLRPVHFVNVKQGWSSGSSTKYAARFSSYSWQSKKIKSYLRRLGFSQLAAYPRNSSRTSRRCTTFDSKEALSY